MSNAKQLIEQVIGSTINETLSLKQILPTLDKIARSNGGHRSIIKHSARTPGEFEVTYNFDSIRSAEEFAEEAEEFADGMGVNTGGSGGPNTELYFQQVGKMVVVTFYNAIK